MSPGLLQLDRQISKRATFLVLLHPCVRFLMTYLAALPLGGDLSKVFKVLASLTCGLCGPASLTCGLCGLARHLIPHNFHPG